MNKKEKFYKNLSEFNIQKPKLEKVEFKDIKTLDKLEKTASSLQKKVFETYNDYTEFIDLDDEKIKVEQAKERLGMAKTAL